eukprot:TRINITY_DN7746_c0_g2_i2.p1 TRINITY_DN7746_c0_g2~~TRINITY_DN7746_c0_g2_i2.p1  ORF type:complete len:337 (-),score=95.85 TRINITY_DN7746_c0_g2_i2:37-1047(-)
MKVNARFLENVLHGGGTSPTSAVTTHTLSSSQEPSQTPLNASSSSSASQPVTTFELLYSETGYSNTKTWFTNNATGSNSTFNESQFLFFMGRLTDFSENENRDIFDLFDKEETGLIGFEGFFLIISLLAARECGQCTKFLYRHGKEVFDLVSAAASTSYSGTTILVTFERFSQFGLVLGMSEMELLAMLQPFDVTLFDMLDVDRFLLYYFMILDAYDRKKNPLAIDEPIPQQQQQQQQQHQQQPQQQQQHQQQQQQQQQPQQQSAVDDHPLSKSQEGLGTSSGSVVVGEQCSNSGNQQQRTQGEPSSPSPHDEHVHPPADNEVKVVENNNKCCVIL